MLNSAESRVINTIYEHCEKNIFMTNLKSDWIENFQDNQLQKYKTTIDFPPRMIDIEKKLIDGSFSTIHDLDEGERVPSISGIYCIKIIEGGKIPKEFGIVENKEIIYIGIASKSLKERLWEEELNHLRPATFFRSIGAMLGFLPPKGSLIGKKNKRNYKFSSEDTEKIKNWMRDSLLVNFVPLPQERLEIFETLWIEKLTPLINIKHNPYANEQLKMARKKCVNWANSKS